ncbi:MAG TPA: aminotransferase class I/II-fold pyridoxal phosphate-dependent enzyme, partial [Saprospiraceae bacterium]|nr:aminotransferase class I/II-fold pyridoxal phosphate-dependent enzyme [Saprospiraceae bacterium]
MKKAQNSEEKFMDISHILNHLGEDREQYFNAVAPPVVQSSNFALPSIAAFREAFSDELHHHVYTRGNNPTVEILRAKVAALEGCEDALVFSSGSAAVAAAVLSQVAAGDHIVCVRSPYSWTHILMTRFLPRFGVSHTFVDGTDMAEIEAAIQTNTRLLYLESPNSLTYELQDLEACARLARAHGIVTCIDNSHASPIFQNPAAMDIDMVVHSGTKYLNGHSDVVCGVVCSTKERIRKIFEAELMTLGAIPSPHDAALIIRGLRTLELRMQRSHDSALRIAEWLEQHPKVERVLHPWLPSFPQHELAKKQMRGAGGLFSIYLKAERIEEVEVFCNRLNRFLMAVSWGGYESLMLPMAGFYKIPGKGTPSRPWNLIRFYIGLEDPDWLIEDLRQA